MKDVIHNVYNVEMKTAENQASYIARKSVLCSSTAFFKLDGFMLNFLKPAVRSFRSDTKRLDARKSEW